jgi:hypothetical protein
MERKIKLLALGVGGIAICLFIALIYQLPQQDRTAFLGPIQLVLKLFFHIIFSNPILAGLFICLVIVVILKILLVLRRNEII